MNRLILLGIVGALAPLGAIAQSIPYSTSTFSGITFTGSGTYQVPSNVNAVLVTGCANGGPGGGGQASASTAGGGGGGAAECISNIPMQVTPGSALTLTIPASPSGGAIGGVGTDAANTTVSGFSGGGAITLYAGNHGLAGGAGVGGAGGGGGGNGQAVGCGTGGGSAGANGTDGAVFGGSMWCGPGGGGGGSTASAAGRSGKPATGFINVLGGFAGAGGSGNGSGGGGGGTIFGNGQPGVAVNTGCSSTPTWSGYGGGGCGGGANGAGGPGGPAFVAIVPNG